MLTLFPLSITLGMLPVGGGALAVRASMLGLCLWGAGRLSWRFWRSELAWITLLIVFLLGSAVSAYASGATTAVQDLFRQALVALFSASLLLILRRPSSRVLLCRAMIVPAVVGVLLVLALYVRLNGLEIPSLTDVRAFKFRALATYGVALNPISFVIALAAVMGVPQLPRRHWRRIAAVAIAIVLLLSGSRGTVVTIAVAFLLVPVIRAALGRSSGKPRWGRLAALGLIAALLVGWGLSSPPDVPTEGELSSTTVGRTGLWVAAVATFYEDPLVGTGAGTWREGLERHLPSYGNFYEYQAVLSLESGGFHNAYLTTLAEKGLVGFVPGALLVGYPLLLSFRGTRRPGDEVVVRSGQLVMLMLLIRGVVEHGGLLGYANGLVDFQAFAAASLVVAAYAARGTDPIAPEQGEAGDRA